MAKKKKQKKAGIAKRQATKQQKRVAIKRKIQASKPPEKKQMSMTKVKKTLRDLPNLIFEPEMQEFAFTAEQVATVEEQFKAVPDQIEALMDEEAMLQLKKSIQAMEQRFESAQDSKRALMCKAMLYYMEQEHSPAFLNQIVVSLFYQTLWKRDNPETPYSPELLKENLSEYDQTWESYLEAKMQALTGGVPQGDFSDQMGETIDESDDDEEIEPSHFEGLLSDFEDHIAEQGEEELDRVVEDVEALCYDYCQDKEIQAVEELRARKIKNFLEGWFVRSMNPTPEDVELMIQSLTKFYSFLKEQNLLEEEACSEVLSYLENKEEIQARIQKD